MKLTISNMKRSICDALRSEATLADALDIYGEDGMRHIHVVNMRNGGIVIRFANHAEFTLTIAQTEEGDRAACEECGALSIRDGECVDCGAEVA